MATTDALLKVSPAQHIAQRKNERSPSSEILSFPANLGAHATLMRFFQYTYGGAKGSKEQKLAEVLLPLPKQIQDSFKINVGGDELGLTGSIASQIAGSAGGGEGGVGTALKNLAGATAQVGEGAYDAAKSAVLGDFTKFQEGLGKTTDAAGFLTTAGLSKISADIANGIGVGRGTAVNPFATLVFKGVDLKVHSLEWLLAPETEAESLELKKIIRVLQRMVLPTTENPVGKDTNLTSVDKGILRYPAMVNVYLQGIDDTYYFRFKTSMISQLNIDYSPNGVAPLKGGKPSAVRITMTLNEAYIHTADDNTSAELEEEVFEERLIGNTEDLDNFDNTDTTVIPTLENTGMEAAFTNLLAEDEVAILKTNPDGSTEVSTMLKEDLIEQGITDDMITGGGVPGDATVQFLIKE
jgi:hypothetical protein